MKKILLISNSSVSTITLLRNAINIAYEQGLYDYEFKYIQEDELKGNIYNTDIILLSPQFKFLLKKLNKTLERSNIPIDTIDLLTYGRMDGNALLQQVNTLMAAQEA